MRNIRKKEISSIKRDIIIGIIVSAIWWLLQWIIKNIPRTGKTVFASVQDIIYSCASQLSSDSIILLIFELMIVVFISIMIIPLFIRILERKHNKIDQGLSELEKDMDRLEENLPKNAQEVKMATEELMRIQKELDKYKKSKKKSVNVVVLTIFAIVYLLFVVFSIIIPLNLVNAFNRDIQMIKPYTDSHTIMMLESEWTRMGNKDDFNNIYSQIITIKQENNLL